MWTDIAEIALPATAMKKHDVAECGMVSDVEIQARSGGSFAKLEIS
jgi:hypothetical protein